MKTSFKGPVQSVERGGMKIAVIGSGIGGLSSAWFLSKHHQVTIYEAHPKLGMGAHAVDIPRASTSAQTGMEHARVDVPMRVFFPEYYPTLSEMYRQAGVEVETLEYSASFSSMTGELLFRYTNYPIAGRSIPFLYLRDLLKPSMVRLGLNVASFLRVLSEKAAEVDSQSSETLGAFLDRINVNERVAKDFLLPAYAGICTCSYENLLNYPASVVLAYLTSGLISAKMHRAKAGVDDVVATLSTKAESIRLASPIEAVLPVDTGVEVITKSGERDRYDHVVIATQANQAIEMLKSISQLEKEALTAFNYEGFDVVIHSDEALAPKNKSWWAPVNYLLQSDTNAPMATIPLNSVHKDLDPTVPVFQTWNPLIEPRAEQTYHQVKLFRPLMDSDAQRGQALIAQLHQQEERKIWFCGSFASPGIPLQESAAVSAFNIAQSIELQAAESHQRVHAA